LHGVSKNKKNKNTIAQNIKLPSIFYKNYFNSNKQKRKLWETINTNFFYNISYLSQTSAMYISLYLYL